MKKVIKRVVWNVVVPRQRQTRSVVVDRRKKNVAVGFMFGQKRRKKKNWCYCYPEMDVCHGI